mgnify:CR=1 FL=1
MAITDIQISEELMTNAPSIKYSGNEGPKSPQEMEQMIMASLEEERMRVDTKRITSRRCLLLVFVVVVFIFIVGRALLLRAAANTEGVFVV